MRSTQTPPSVARLLNSNSSHQNMSPRATVERAMPSISSPLSPRTEPLAIPSQARRRPAQARQTSNGPGHLRLPSLPRFHPANFPSSQSSSQAATPNTGPNSPYSPASPRSASSRQYEVQRQMYAYQQQLLANTSRHVRDPNAKPTSPRLAPLASPGAVTPLELEKGDGYLTAGVNPIDAAMHVENIIRNEARRRGECSPGRTAAVGRH